MLFWKAPLDTEDTGIPVGICATKPLHLASQVDTLPEGKLEEGKVGRKNVTFPNQRVDSQ